MSSEIAIRVQNVSKRYELYDTPRDRLKQFILPRLQRLGGAEGRSYFREFWALRDISFEVRKGESVGIVGRNGSGKSTLLQIITGVLSPSEGQVETHGRIAALLELGSGFNVDYTGRENVYLNGALLGLSRQQIDAKFDNIASFADIGGHLDQPVKTYSSGMLVRLAFAVQVQLEPDILIVDEALAVGDALFQKRCFQQIERLVSNGVSLLFVSHDQESVRTLTNRALLLKSGRKVSWGVSSEVILDYRRLLHDEEAAYFAGITRRIEASARQAQPETERTSAPAAPSGEVAQSGDAIEAANPRTAAMSFGAGEARILKVETLNAELEPCSIYYPEDEIYVRVLCRSDVEVSKLNVALRIRNKEGFKIYSWGTLNQDMKAIARNGESPVFWERSFVPGEEFEVLFRCDCKLGVNLYEIQASVSHEGRPDYTDQRLLHWVDEAAFFQVLMKKEVSFFGGVVDLQMEATW